MSTDSVDDVAAGTTVLRADAGAYRRWFGQPVRGLGLLVALVGGGVVSALRRGDGALLLGIIVGTAVLTLGFIAILIATSRVILTDDHIEQRRWFVRTRLRRRDLVGALAEFNGSPVGRTSQLLVLRSRSGGRRIWLNGAYWDQQDLVLVAQAADVPVLDEALTPREFERVAPGSMPWRTLHPRVFGTAFAVVLVALIAAAVVSVFEHKGLPPFDDQPPRAVSPQVIAAQDSIVTAVERTLGGDWETPRVRLVTCQDDDDYKGWSRYVDVRLRETVVEETGEDRIVTPLTPTAQAIEALGQTLVEAGNPEPYVDPDELADFGADGYLRVTSIPDGDDPSASTVDIAFSGGQGYATISVSSGCETPPR